MTQHQTAWAFEDFATADGGIDIQRRDNNTLHDIRLMCRPMDMWTVKSKKGELRQKPAVMECVIVATNMLGGDRPWSVATIGGGTIVKCLELLCVKLHIECRIEGRIMGNAAVFNAMICFIDDLLSEARKRAAQTLIRLFRNRAFACRIRARIQARIALGKSPVFCDLPRDMVRVFGDQWL